MPEIADEATLALPYMKLKKVLPVVFAVALLTASEYDAVRLLTVPLCIGGLQWILAQGIDKKEVSSVPCCIYRYSLSEEHPHPVTTSSLAPIVFRFRIVWTSRT